LCDFMLSVVMLCVIMLNVVMLNVVALHFREHKRKLSTSLKYKH
jgi:hypothetical protein